MRERSDAVARQMVPAEALLELAASGYERAQRDRIRYGEQIRAILQRRDARWGPVADSDRDGDPDALLREIREVGGGPVPLLGRLYANAWEQEREMGAQMQALISRHPAWKWLRSVRGVGSVLAARLLSRLDIWRAPSPASFWAYCGLGTVAAEEQVCEECGARVFVAPGTRVQAPHTRAGQRGTCTGALRPRGLTGSVRVAQARPRRGERAAYDLEAKTICYLIGVSFVRCGGPYREVYDERKVHLATHHPDWPAKRVHLAAVRATVKRFLADLWVAWREAEGDMNGNTTAEAR
jgi:Transposase IS116/IS110/IS902 family